MLDGWVRCTTLLENLRPDKAIKKIRIVYWKPEKIRQSKDQKGCSKSRRLFLVHTLACETLLVISRARHLSRTLSSISVPHSTKTASAKAIKMVPHQEIISQGGRSITPTSSNLKFITSIMIVTGETISSLQDTLVSESQPLARRFRALFSLKHFACLTPPTDQTLPAIQAIAAAFASPSALLKHELAYCLGQTRNAASVPFLQHVLENKLEDSMCRHEAAEALGALGDVGSLGLLRGFRDDKTEVEVVRETCDIAVARIEWESSEARKTEKLKQRQVYTYGATDLRRLAKAHTHSDIVVSMQRFCIHRSRSATPADFYKTDS